VPSRQASTFGRARLRRRRADSRRCRKLAAGWLPSGVESVSAHSNLLRRLLGAGRGVRAAAQGFARHGARRRLSRAREGVRRPSRSRLCGCRDPVAAVALCLVKRGVGPLEQPCSDSVPSQAARPAEQLSGAGVRARIAPDHRYRVTRRAGGHQERDLVAADPREHVLGAQHLARGVPSGSAASLPRRDHWSLMSLKLSMSITARLRGSTPARVREAALELKLPRSTVAQTGRRVGVGHVVQLVQPPVARKVLVADVGNQRLDGRAPRVVGPVDSEDPCCAAPGPGESRTGSPETGGARRDPAVL
jgi:hypothetical protein